MAGLKDALNDYIHDNFNKTKQGRYLQQTQSQKGIPLPLKDDQIKVAKRD